MDAAAHAWTHEIIIIDVPEPCANRSGKLFTFQGYNVSVRGQRPRMCFGSRKSGQGQMRHAGGRQNQTRQAGNHRMLDGEQVSEPEGHRDKGCSCDGNNRMIQKHRANIGRVRGRDGVSFGRRSCEEPIRVQKELCQGLNCIAK